jgi:hypothetical protein
VDPAEDHVPVVSSHVYWLSLVVDAGVGFERLKRKLETASFVVDFPKCFYFRSPVLSARFEATMINLDAQVESFSAQFGSFGYWFYYYFN